MDHKITGRDPIAAVAHPNIMRTSTSTRTAAAAAAAAMATMWRRPTELRCLQGAAILVSAYLCAGELLPLPVIKASPVLSRGWYAQQVVLLAALSCLVVLLGSAGCHDGSSSSLSIGCAPPPTSSAPLLLAALNVIPVIAAVAATFWFALSDNCPLAYPPSNCDRFGVVGRRWPHLRAAGAARPRCVPAAGHARRGLLAVCRQPRRLGYHEAVPLHRSVGWCAAQSAIHTAAYVLFYLHTGGARGLWLNVFPARLPSGELNRLGLVNFLGLLASLAMAALVLPALPRLRHRYYHAFQRLHATTGAAFVLCCALHDLPILLFATPGLATWLLGRGQGVDSKVVAVSRRVGAGAAARSALLGRRGRRRPARAELLPHTSGPWVELTIDGDGDDDEGMGGMDDAAVGAAPRGRWVSVAVCPLGRERHPLSVTLSASSDGAARTITTVVSASGGDWSRALVALSQSPATATFDVEVHGPFSFGGAVDWALRGVKSAESSIGGGGSSATVQKAPPALLLLAGGTGVTAWLPALAASHADDGGAARVELHLVWCVQSEGDYHCLAWRLPTPAQAKVTVYITRAATNASAACAPLMSAPAAGDPERGAVLVALAAG